MKLRFCLLLITVIPFSITAQKPETKGIGEIRGIVIDSASKQPIEYAAISLVKQDNNKVVDGATTDNKGGFKISNIAEGTYKMLVYFMGYQPLTKTDIVVNKTNPEVFLGKINLINTAVVMNEVVISKEKNVLESNIDKMVYNAEKDVTSQGGVATDILKKIPMVTVNSDGTVELLGNSDIRFLIDGKPSTVFGNNIVDVLQTIPASQIQSIEVITSPGAKYDAQGTGGIINIILKKSTVQGINGSISATGGSRLENTSVNLAARKGKFGVTTFFSGNAQLLSTTLNTSNRESYNTVSGTTSLLQNGTSNFTRSGFQTGISMDWDITEKDNITGTFNCNDFGNNSSGSTNRLSILKDTLGNTISNTTNLVLANSHFNTQAYDWSLSYKKKLKKEGHVLDAMYSSSFSNNYSYYQQTQKFITPDSVFNSSYGKNPGTELLTNISVNYAQPISEKVTFETGAKTVLDNIYSPADVFLLNLSTNNYDFNNSQSTTTNYRRNIYAAYVSGTFKLKYVDIKAGLRNEYTDTKANFSSVGNVAIAPYNTVVPSGTISHKFDNNSTLKISYSYRIQRPQYSDLNPFLNASDPKNITGGNPNLKPETANNFELGYNQLFKKGITINIAAFYRENLADLQSYTNYYSTYTIGDSTYNNVSVSLRENIGKENDFGMNLFSSVTINEKLTLRANLSPFQRYIYNSINPGDNISGFNYRANMNMSYQISKTFVIELFGNFNSPRVSVQGKTPQFYTYNFALRKQFFNKKLSIAFTTTNPFYKYVNQQTETNGVGFTLNSLKQIPYRSFGINITWKFGKLEFKKQKEAEDYNLTTPPSTGSGN